jgi:hypothetical protein
METILAVSDGAGGSFEAGFGGGFIGNLSIVPQGWGMRLCGVGKDSLQLAGQPFSMPNWRPALAFGLY